MKEDTLHQILFKISMTNIILLMISQKKYFINHNLSRVLELTLLMSIYLVHLSCFKKIISGCLSRVLFPQKNMSCLFDLNTSMTTTCI